MAPLRAPRASGATADLSELAGLWLQGLNRSHDPGCGCGGLFSPALESRVIEEDFLDYLHARYERESLGDLAAFVEARRKDSTRGIAPNTFERWVVALASALLNVDDKARLVADITTFVESMAGATRRAPGVCY